MRFLRPNGVVLCLAILAACATHCSSTSKTEKAPACAAGETKHCAGSRGCDGTQTCNSDGTAFSLCECIDAGLAGTRGSGGSSGFGGASGSGAVGGAVGNGGISGASGAPGSGGVSGTGGAGGSADAGGPDAMSGSGGTTGSAGSGGAGGRGGSAGTIGSGGRGGSAGTTGSGGSGGVPDASPGCTTECLMLVNSCPSMVAEQCACSQCGCEVTTCLRNSDCLSVALCALQSCTSWGACVSPGGPCGAAYNALPQTVQPVALAVGSCLLIKACPTCNTP